jgi:hypothetical protein
VATIRRASTTAFARTSDAGAGMASGCASL